MKPNNPLGRHSGAGRNPVKEDSPRMRGTFASASGGQIQGVVPITWGFVNYLDSGLRRNDAALNRVHMKLLFRHRQGALLLREIYVN